MSKITKETGKTLASEIIKDLEKEARNKIWQSLLC